MFFIYLTRRSFAGEALERERFGADVVASYHSGVGFARAKANVESINRCCLQALHCPLHCSLHCALHAGSS